MRGAIPGPLVEIPRGHAAVCDVGTKFLADKGGTVLALVQRVLPQPLVFNLSLLGLHQVPANRLGTLAYPGQACGGGGGGGMAFSLYIIPKKANIQSPLGWTSQRLQGKSQQPCLHSE